jgi:hypothetical protein
MKDYSNHIIGALPFRVERVVLGAVRFRVIGEDGIVASFAKKRDATAKANRLNEAYVPETVIARLASST